MDFIQENSNIVFEDKPSIKINTKNFAIILYIALSNFCNPTTNAPGPA